MNSMDEKQLYKKRKLIYVVTVISLALLWYVVTGLESARMGLHPLCRRSFTIFDFIFYALIIAGFIFVHRWHRRCPICKKKMSGSVYSPQCLNCGFGQKKK